MRNNQSHAPTNMVKPSSDGPMTIADAVRRRAILFATCAALMAVVASASGLSVVQQQMALDLHASQGDVIWIINAYIVTLAALLLPVGAIADRWGRKPVLVIGLAVFGMATAAAGFVDTVNLMIAVRILAGIGAAMVMPVTLSVITSSFPEDARSQAIGVWTAVAGGGGLLGMISSALLASFVSWRWIFALPVVLVAVAFTLAVRVVPNSRQRVSTGFDVLGSVLSIIGAGGLVLAIYEGPVQGWSAPVTISFLAAGALAIVGFVMHELRCAAPLLDVRVFRGRRLRSGSATLTVIFGVQAGVFVVLFPYFEAVLGWSPIRSLLGLLPMLAIMMGASGLAPKVAKRSHVRATTLSGVTLAAVGLGLMAALVSVRGGYPSILPGLLLIGLGMGLAMPLSTEAITSSLPLERQGVASALNDATRELGSALGIALLGAVLTAAYRNAIAPALIGFPKQVANTASQGIGDAFDVANRQYRGHQAQVLLDAARSAFVHGWARSMWIGSAAMFLLLLFLVIQGPRFSAEFNADIGPTSANPRESDHRRDNFDWQATPPIHDSMSCPTNDKTSAQGSSSAWPSPS
jgi:EmrB/QacA subfamily drug resistance transporter